MLFVSRLNYTGTHWLLYTARDRGFPFLPRSEIRNADFRHFGSPKHRPSAFLGFGSPKCRLSAFRKAKMPISDNRKHKHAKIYHTITALKTIRNSIYNADAPSYFRIIEDENLLHYYSIKFTI